MTGSVSSTSLILSAETLARGIMMNTIDIIRKAKIICTAYCMKAIMSPTCIVPSFTWWAPTQMMTIITPFMRSIIAGIKNTMTPVDEEARFGQVLIGLVELGFFMFLGVEGADDHQAGEVFAHHQVEFINQLLHRTGISAATTMNMTTIMVISRPTAAPIIQSMELSEPSTLMMPPMPIIGA